MSGDYSQFAAAAESGFVPVPLIALDEYGLPLEVARKVQRLLVPPGTDHGLDAVLERLRHLPVERLGLSAFEQKLLQEAQQGL